MKGSMLFNKDINIEVDVDPAAEEGARLISAKNLVDGQEAGGGGGSSLPSVTSADEGKVLAVNASGEWAAENRRLIVLDNEGTLNKTFAEIKAALDSFIGADIYFIDEYQTQAIPVYSCEIDGADYVVSALSGTVVQYKADSADGYPSSID